MTFKIHSDANKVISQIKGSIAFKNKPSDMKWNILFKKELIGNINGNKLWLQKTRPHINRSPQRYFEGTILDYSGYIIIEGKFKFSKASKVYFVFIMSLFSIVSILSRFSTRDGYLSIGMLVSLIIIWIISMFFTFGLGALLFKKEEREVVSFLNSLR